MTTRKASPRRTRRHSTFRKRAHFPLSVVRINQKTIRSSDREPKWDHEVGANIGLEGLGILSEKRLPPRAQVRVEFLLPGECTDDTELLQAEGRIRWSRPCTIRGKKLHFMDLEFARLSPKARAQIQRFLDEPS